MKVLAIVLVASSTAHAECPITVTAAPDDVRQAIESWAHREQVCGPPLEVRVVQMEAGLYLFARDLRNRTRERVVPDADSAAVLVASWMADDSFVAPPVVDVRVHVDVDPETGQVREGDTQPAPIEPRPRVASAPAVTFGAMAGYDGWGATRGLRAELEFARLGRWAVSAVGSIGNAGMDANTSSGRADTTDYRALLSVGPTLWFGAWSLRPALAFGLLARTAHFDMRDDTHATRTFELSLSLARSIGGVWSVVLEPMYIGSSLDAGTIDANGTVTYQDGPMRPNEIDVLLGLRRGL